jgi:hypothetical protein
MLEKSICMDTRIVNLREEDYDIYIGRGSKWGNPYTHLAGKTLAQYKVKSREEAIRMYKEYILNTPSLLNSIYELEGKILGCYCKPKACHGDVLIEILYSFSSKDGSGLFE